MNCIKFSDTLMNTHLYVTIMRVCRFTRSLSWPEPYMDTVHDYIYIYLVNFQRGLTEPKKRVF